MQNRNRLNSSQGFTLLELLIVAAVLAGLMAVAIFSYPATQRRARDTQRLSDLNQYKTALATYASYNNGKFPVRVSTTSLDDLCGELNVPDCPVDPKVSQGYLYRYQSNSTGTQFVAWFTKEAEKDPTKQSWAQCSNGNSGILNSTPVGGNCDITIPEQPEPVSTATPIPYIPTNTPIPTSGSTPSPTPIGQPNSSNLILNYSFEQAKDNWNLNTDGSVSFRVISGGTDGSSTSEIIKTADDDTNTQLMQISVDLKPNTNYELSLDAKSNNGNAVFIVNIIKHVSPFGDYGIGSYVVDTTTSWKTFTTTFLSNSIASDDARLRFNFRSTNVSRTHIDNVILKEI